MFPCVSTIPDPLSTDLNMLLILTKQHHQDLLTYWTQAMIHDLKGYVDLRYLFEHLCYIHPQIWDLRSIDDLIKKWKSCPNCVPGGAIWAALKRKKAMLKCAFECHSKLFWGKFWNVATCAISISLEVFYNTRSIKHKVCIRCFAKPALVGLLYWMRGALGFLHDGSSWFMGKQRIFTLGGI